MQLRAHASLSRWFATGRILLPAILVIWPGIVHAGAPPAAPKVPASLPLAPDCLIAGRIRDLRALSDKVGEILAAMDRAPDRGHVRLALGARLYNPKLAGVDTSRPLRFYGMNAKKFPRPWVYQFEVSDIAALKQGIASGQHPTPAGKGIWRFDDLAGIVADGGADNSIGGRNIQRHLCLLLGRNILRNIDLQRSSLQAPCCPANGPCYE